MVFGEKNKNVLKNKNKNQTLEKVDTFKYLGVLFSKTKSLFKTKQNVAEQARKAMLSLLRKVRNLDLPIDCKISYLIVQFYQCLTYNCEILGIWSSIMYRKSPY